MRHRKITSDLAPPMPLVCSLIGTENAKLSLVVYTEFYIV